MISPFIYIITRFRDLSSTCDWGMDSIIHNPSHFDCYTNYDKRNCYLPAVPAAAQTAYLVLVEGSEIPPST